VSTDKLPDMPRARRYVRGATRLSYEFTVLILFAATAAFTTAFVLEIQASATAYIIGESHWSKGQQDAVRELYRYAGRGDPADLKMARQALSIPLGDRDARLALERDVPDLAAARDGFLRGNNAPGDVGRLIWMFRYFRDMPYFSTAVDIWRGTDAELAELAGIADELERSARSDLGAVEIERFQDRLIALDARLRPVKLAFSETLSRGARALNVLLVAMSVLAFIIFAWIAIVVLRSAQRRIRQSESVHGATFHQAVVGMLEMDSGGRLLEVNDAFCRILGWNADQLRGRNIAELVHPEDLDAASGDVSTWLGPTVEQRFSRHDGTTRWLRRTASEIATGSSDEVRVLAIVEDVSEAHELASEVSWQATHDVLTGLVNRREIERRLGCTLASRRDGTRHSLCFIDLDYFKLVNDTCGHAAGDRFLCEAASVLKSFMWGEDWVGRLGGDEFAALLHDTAIDDAERIAERLCRALAETVFICEGRSFAVTASIGIAEVNAATLNASDLLCAADRACYLVKEEGRNGVRAYRDSDETIARRRTTMAWVGGIRRAIEEERVLLYAQRIQAVSGNGLSYEVLVRLRDPSGRIYEPADFLPAAETYGEIATLDRRIITMTLNELAANPRHLAELDLCHINVSAQSIAQPEFRLQIGQLLDRSAVPAQKLCFEITETAAIGNIAHARAFIDTMRSRGALIALDDFGSGLSSFAYIKNLPVDIIKIDGIFVRDLIRNEIDPVLVRSICEVAHSLGKAAIAECVESVRVHARLEELGADYVQGFAIHRPCPLAELIAIFDAEAHMRIAV